MTFTVTYRVKDGALHEECVEAANRAERVAECRKRGIAPTKIVEGKRANRRDGARPSRVGAEDNKRTTARWIAAAVVVAAIAGGAWWWMGRGEEKPKTASVQQQGVKKPKAERPQKPRKAEPAARPTETAVRGDVRPDKKRPVDDKHYREGFHTNQYGYVINPRRPRPSCSPTGRTWPA